MCSNIIVSILRDIDMEDATSISDQQAPHKILKYL